MPKPICLLRKHWRWKKLVTVPILRIFVKFSKTNHGETQQVYSAITAHIYISFSFWSRNPYVHFFRHKNHHQIYQHAYWYWWACTNPTAQRTHCKWPVLFGSLPELGHHTSSYLTFGSRSKLQRAILCLPIVHFAPKVWRCFWAWTSLACLVHYLPQVTPRLTMSYLGRYQRGSLPKGCHRSNRASPCLL